MAGLARHLWDDSTTTEGKRGRYKAASTKLKQAADSERKTRWKRGPVNSTPTSFSPRESESQTWTTRPWVATSASLFLSAEKRFPFAVPACRSGWARCEPYYFWASWSSWTDSHGSA